MSGTRGTSLTWTREEDEDWAATVEVRLVLRHDAPVGLADEVLAEAHEIVTEAGRPAPEVLGTPEEYARTVAAERIGEAHRARVDADGLTPGERIVAAQVSLGLLGLGLCVLDWVQDGLWAEVTPSGAAALAAIALTLACASFAVVAGAAGRWRGMGGFAAGGVTALLGGGVLAAVLPEERLFRVPLPVLALGCAAVAAAAAALPKARIDRWLAAPPPAGDDEAWLARLGRLLRGRHAMPAAEARGHVREARQHLAAAPEGESAEDAFGDVEVYALRLAEGPARKGRLARRKLWGTGAAALFFTVLLVDDLVGGGGGSPFWTALHVAVVTFLLWALWTEWREIRPAPRRPAD
ncbi:hypothetical protein AB0I16_03835 [Streptomyces sp. NPDC050703]|uniref:hypothetical protein n=1 Tax=Streptomyces sp. NPDC050703 TaxID=3157218 RepID=UPI003425DB54